jgi:signal transduction histidine kinase/CheY-like chemotaxis protein
LFAKAVNKRRKGRFMQNGTRSLNEISRQLELIRSERWSRISLSVLAMLLTAIYLPIWVVILCILGNVAGDVLSMRYMRALSPSRHPTRYRIVMALVFQREFFFTLPAALVWQTPENYGHSLAVGMIMAQLLQLAMVRAIHVPFGDAGISAIAALTFASNTYYWTRIDTNLTGLVVSTIAALAAFAYTLITMRANHRLHSNFAADRAAALAGDKAKSRFLAQMSHELRTPLNAILGMGHAELRRNRDALSQNRLSVLISSAEGLSTILDDILDMSAIDAGRLPIRPQVVVPKAEIAATLALFQPGITEAGLELTQDIGTNLDRNWKLDPQRLRQCITNLMSNAIKNTTEGGIHVSAYLMPQLNGSSVLCVEVADSGPGIPSNLHRSVFEPFSHSRKAKPGAESNGLGLSICRAMARQMGGDLTVAPNVPGKSGARFILTLALEAAQIETVQETQKGQAAQIAPESPKPGTAGLKVLVIDDIATNRLVASTYLRMLGATMIEADSGAQALEILGVLQPDLVLLDMNMPEMNGLETLKKIRALPGAAGKLPVIAMTADAMAEHRAQYLASGVDGYLAKPIHPARIEAEIKTVLDNARRSSSN